MVGKQWELFSCELGYSPCAIMLLWDDPFNYCRADLQSHLPDHYLVDSFDTWLRSHHFHSICTTCDNLRMRGRTSTRDTDTRTCARRLALYEIHLDICLKHCCPWFLKTRNELYSNFESSEIQRRQVHVSHAQLYARTATVYRNQSVIVYHRSSLDSARRLGRPVK